MGRWANTDSNAGPLEISVVRYESERVPRANRLDRLASLGGNPSIGFSMVSR